MDSIMKVAKQLFTMGQVISLYLGNHGNLFIKSGVLLLEPVGHKFSNCHTTGYTRTWLD